MDQTWKQKSQRRESFKKNRRQMLRELSCKLLGIATPKGSFTGMCRHKIQWLRSITSIPWNLSSAAKLLISQKLYKYKWWMIKCWKMEAIKNRRNLEMITRTTLSLKSKVFRHLLGWPLHNKFYLNCLWVKLSQACLTKAPKCSTVLMITSVMFGQLESHSIIYYAVISLFMETMTMWSNFA